MKRWLWLLVVGLALPGLGGPVVDQAGRAVHVPANPSRVASVFGVATAYVYALGAGELLVGARYLGIPDSPLARGVMARLDPGWERKAFPAELTVEALVALRADLVLGGIRHLALVKALGEVGIPAAVYAPESVSGVREAIRMTGAILGREGRAEELIAFLDGVLLEVATRGSPGPRPRVLFVGTEVGRVAAAGMYQWELITLAGGEPVGPPGTSWQNVSPEQILRWNPDVVVIAPYGAVTPAHFLGEPAFRGLRAVETGRVYKMPQLLFAWDNPIPESALGVLWLARLLQPAVDLPLAEFALRFYRDFYGVDLGEAELAAIIGP
ncbi:MAG: ABC transporter substrate-binding protein [Candidatus Bipolaricaulota bacterium]|nr:ABC transporter substrate-binding protein [Candidatus Bipolaricaulota bacterium]